MQNNSESLSTQTIIETPKENLGRIYNEIGIFNIKKGVSEYVNKINTFYIGKRNIAKENISGDIVVSYDTNNGKKISVLGDVQGSGDVAGEYANKIKNFIEEFKPSSVKDLISSLDNYIEKNDLPYLVMIFSEYNYKTGELEITSVGHNCPIFIIENNGVKELEISSSGNFGINIEVQPEKIKTKRNFGILMHSDGFIEKAKKGGEKRHSDFLSFLDKNKVRFAKMEPNQIINYIIKNFGVLKGDDISFIYQKISALSNLQ